MCTILNIDIKDFWHGDSLQEKNENPLLQLLRISGKVVINTSAPDAVICSCFGDEHTHTRDGIMKIQYLGENLPPDTMRYHCSLGFR